MMEQASTANAKVSDSGYSNTCSNSQSQRSSDSSISRNSNRSESSGYCGRRPSAFESSNEAPPQPISKRKDKEHKKKKSKAVLAGSAVPDTKDGGQLPESGPYDVGGQAKPTNEGKLEEVADVELVDATDPGEHNGDTIADAVADPRRNNTLDDSTSQASEGFCAVISMHDGLVLYTTPTICTALGYPRDAWIGRSFINYVHPKDKATLAERITTGIASPQGDQPKGINGRRASLFCGLRKQTRCSNQQPSGQRSQARSNLYLPFHLSLSFRDFRDRADDEQQPRAMFLVVTAQPVHSAYKAAEEMIISSIFTTRHTATCHLSHVDPDVVQYFGYLPQDMVGRSLFEFYHPEDLPFIKDIYETVIRLKGGSFRSRPYRFGVQNGGYVVLETVWSSFINPWTKKLEFVVGQHRVLKGPLDPDVFRVPAATDCDRLAGISEEVLKEAKVIQGEIRALLHESVHRTSGIPEHEVSKRCKDLASFMESLLEEVKAPGHGRDALVPDERSFSEYDSLMLGVMSPHHEYCDSKSSTETPPSYNQLNYNENLERFFKSKPTVAMMYSSDEENVNSSNDDGKNSPAPVARKCMSPINGSGASGTGSAENLSSGSNNQASSGSRCETSNTATSNATNEGFKQPTLTESLLNRHNKDMEKLMMQKHRELRFSIKNSDKLKDSRIKATQKTTAAVSNQRFANQGHGVKRTGSHSWEGDSFKVSKHEEISRTSTAGQFPGDTTTALTNVGVDPRPPCAPPQNGTTQAIPRIPILPPMIPVYYVPVQPQTSNGCEISTPREKLGPPIPPPSSQPPHPSPYMFVPVSYLTTAMAGVIYPPVNGTPAQGMMYRPFQVPEPTAPTRGDTFHQFQEKFTGRKRPASQTTSVKAEPGNFMTMSESSTKVLSPGELFSSCVSNAGGCSIVTDAPTPKFHRQTESNGDESSSSSFYSSFLYRSSESSCNPDQKPYEYVAEYEKSQRAMQRREPPWLEGVQLTPELIYEYQIHPKALNDVLQTDMDTLKNLNQPLLVNDQLGQLYLDLEVEGFEAKLVLEDGITSSGSDSGSSSGSWTGAGAQKQRRRMVKYGKLVMVHEENAPLPSPPPPPTQSVSCQQS